MAISSLSLVKISMSKDGKKHARIKKTVEIRIEIRIPIPIIRSMVRVSCLPQYWAASIITPEEIPE